LVSAAERAAAATEIGTGTECAITGAGEHHRAALSSLQRCIASVSSSDMIAVQVFIASGDSAICATPSFIEQQLLVTHGRAPEINARRSAPAVSRAALRRRHVPLHFVHRAFVRFPPAAHRGYRRPSARTRRS
jgi:hypothetical protein